MLFGMGWLAKDVLIKSVRIDLVEMRPCKTKDFCKPSPNEAE